MRSMIACGKKLFSGPVVQECIYSRGFSQKEEMKKKLKAKVLSFILLLTFFRHCFGGNNMLSSLHCRGFQREEEQFLNTDDFLKSTIISFVLLTLRDGC